MNAFLPIPTNAVAPYCAVPNNTFFAVPNAKFPNDCDCCAGCVEMLPLGNVLTTTGGALCDSHGRSWPVNGFWN